MNDVVDQLMLRGVARPCPDCAEERLFVPVDLDRVDVGEYCCTWCGAGLRIDPSLAAGTPPARHVA